LLVALALAITLQAFHNNDTINSVDQTGKFKFEIYFQNFKIKTFLGVERVRREDRQTRQRIMRNKIMRKAKTEGTKEEKEWRKKKKERERRRKRRKRERRNAERKRRMKIVQKERKREGRKRNKEER